MGVPICTSLGRPKYPLPYSLDEEVHALKPWGLLDTPEPEFTEKYIVRLEKVGTTKLWRVFHAISNQYDGRRLVLLCHERDAAECHRSTFASWWHWATGHAVYELGWLAGLDGMPVVVKEVDTLCPLP
jgi:hypothetical protein